MESRVFIKKATDLAIRINLPLPFDQVQEQQAKTGIQRDLDALFSGLQNPSLPSASRLANDAQAKGYNIESRVLNRIHEMDTRLKADGYGG